MYRAGYRLIRMNRGITSIFCHFGNCCFLWVITYCIRYGIASIVYSVNNNSLYRLLVILPQCAFSRLLFLGIQFYMHYSTQQE